MERSEFLAKFGMGMAAVCAGCSIVSCGSKGSDPAPANPGSTPPASGGGALLTVDLKSELANIGDSKIASGIILVRLAADDKASSFTAVQSACTHEGTTIGYDNNQHLFVCPLHGSEFSSSGSVVQGPASKALKEYTVTIAANTLTVS